MPTPLHLHVKCTPRQYNRWRAAVSLRGELTLSDWTRKVLDRAARLAIREKLQEQQLDDLAASILEPED